MNLADHYSLEDIVHLTQSKTQIELSEDAKQRVEKCYNYLQNKIKTSERPIYGVNTGFGSLCNTVIKDEDLEQLQLNLLMSHACGTGDYVPQHVVRLMIVLKVLSLTKGHSGVQLKTVEKLINLYNQEELPVLYEQGSLGASGDLAPLAHLALPLLGLGEVWKGESPTSASHLIDPSYHLKAKEGLALINGTQFMSAYGAYCSVIGVKLLRLANKIAALSADAFDSRIDPFLPHSHAIRNQPDQESCARDIYMYLQGSELQEQDKVHVQDPYSFRCAPQVHGASLSAIEHCMEIFTNEVNAVTDNPNVFPDEDLVLSAGNFHGQTLAIQLDHLAVALAEIANISERRTYKLISGERGLPAFLIREPGINSGFMIPQYTAASIVSQNKQLCTPASVDSIVSSNGQEDHVSMGANAATKCYRVLQNTITVLGIELFAATQALEFRRPLKSSEELETFVSSYRDQVSFVEQDTYLSPEIRKSASFIQEVVGA